MMSMKKLSKIHSAAIISIQNGQKPVKFEAPTRKRKNSLEVIKHHSSGGSRVLGSDDDSDESSMVSYDQNDQPPIDDIDFKAEMGIYLINGHG